MITALLGIGTAVFFGAADFLGGLAARRTSAVRATLLSATAGLVVLTAALPLFGAAVWSSGVLVWGTIGGVVAASTVALLYASLAIGPMSILAPLTAVIAAIVPAGYGLILGERLTAAGYVGIGVALVAVVLVGLVPHREAVRARPLGLLLATLAGLSMGAGIIVLDNAPDDSGILPLIVGRAVSIVVMTAAGAIIAARLRSRGRADARGWCSAARFGLPAGVLAGLCSAVTIMLAAIVLRERLAPPQVAGLMLAVVAAGLLSVG
ncbi:MAG: hypothetical protein RI885_529 [Actinomycetota bacterium]